MAFTTSVAVCGVLSFGVAIASAVVNGVQHAVRSHKVIQGKRLSMLESSHVTRDTLVPFLCEDALRVLEDEPDRDRVDLLLLRQEACADEVQRLFDEYNAGRRPSLTDTAPIDVSLLLREYLSALPVSLVPLATLQWYLREHGDAMREESELITILRRLISGLPLAHRHLIKRVFCFLHTAMQTSLHPDEALPALAVSWSPVLIHVPPTLDNGTVEQLRLRAGWMTGSLIRLAPRIFTPEFVGKWPKRLR